MKIPREKTNANEKKLIPNQRENILCAKYKMLKKQGRIEFKEKMQ